MSTNISLPIPTLFSGENFNFWAIKLKAFLMANDLWDIVEIGFIAPGVEGILTDEEEVELKQNKMKSMKALTFIHSAIAENIFPRIMNAETAKEAWDTLKEEFQGSEKVRLSRLQNLRRQFEILNMKESETIKDYSGKLVELVNQMKLLGEDIGDKRVVEKILVTLPSRFESKVSAIEESKDLSTLTITELIGSLQAHEERHCKKNESDMESAFQARHKSKPSFSKEGKFSAVDKGKNKFFDDDRSGDRKKFPPCSICKKTNHLERFCWKNKTCSICNKMGHIEKVCKFKGTRQVQQQRPQQQQRFPAPQQQHVNFAAGHQKEDHLFLASHVTNEVKNADQVWFIDSGCTKHMANNPDMFTQLDESVKVLIRMGDAFTHQSTGKGTVVIHTKHGTKQIRDVLLVPTLGQNLLSVSQMMKNQYDLWFHGEACTIYDPFGVELAVVPVVNDSFPLVCGVQPELAYRVVDESDLWHRRYGHFSLRTLNFLQQKGMVKDMPSISCSEIVCESCQMGKQSRLPFSSGNTKRARTKLELIHTDLCGPMSVASLSNNRYFITFIDDFSRMCWVYFLTNKSQAFSVFQKFKSFVETQSGCKIKVLRSDNGGEYTSSEFNKFFNELGMQHQLTVPYTPQQNGVAERKNRTILEMARCMMHEKGIPKKFWAEAVYTSVYLQNRLPTKAVNGCTPIEAWSGNKPSAKHLRVFGSICYILVPEAKRDKLSNKAQKGILMGYSSQSKGYRIFNLETEKIVTSRDVKFDEDASWNWESKQAVKVSPTLTNIEDVNGSKIDHGSSSDSGSNGDHGPDPYFPDSAQSSSHNGSSPSTSQSSGSLSSSPSTSVSPAGSTGFTVEGTTDTSFRRIRSLSSVYDNIRETQSPETEAEFERCFFACTEPSNFAEAVEKPEWREAMQVELEMIEKNDTWDLVCRPTHTHVIGVKWIYKLKLNSDGTINKHKARLVVKGYAQQPGVDFSETFAPVARLDTIKLILAVAAQKQWRVHQLDVKSAFLNGILEEEIFVEQPEGFLVCGHENKVYKLKKALYGLKQAPRSWYSRINNFLEQQGFRRSLSEATLYVRKTSTKKILIVSIYVDDLLVTGDDLSEIQGFKLEMKNQFEMTDLGEMQYFLGMEIQQHDSGIFISQKAYVETILKKFNMSQCKPVKTPVVVDQNLTKNDGVAKADERQFRSIVGSLLYLTTTRPDIMFAANLLSRYMNSPSLIHLGAAKRVLRYLRGTTDLGVSLRRVADLKLTGYSDSDFGKDMDNGKSTSGYTFTLGSGMFCWNSKKQDVVAQSTAEAEFISCSLAANHAIWLRKLLVDLELQQTEATVINCDNQSAIAIAKNPVHHGKTKHMKIKYYFLKEAESEGEVSLVYCRTEEQLADIFTKALPKGRFEFLRKELGVCFKTSRRSVEV